MPAHYTLTETLQIDPPGRICRGVRKVDGTPVLIKIHSEDETAPRISEQIRHEYKILNQLKSPYILTAIDLERHKEEIWLVMENFDGEPLSNQLGEPFETDRFLGIALQLAAALADIHGQEIVHKYLTSARILIHHKTGAIKLTGFGIAARLVHIPNGSMSAGFMEGTLAYMSPEQTGRMNRGIDHRCDLYSLGIIFYELLTGELPFHASDPLEWVHCHIARMPRRPTGIAPDIPVSLESIVLKLLAKQPEERYQSAHGLQFDLEYCRREWEEKCRIDHFPLGKEDLSDKFLISPKLYGREDEVAKLRENFKGVLDSGQARFVLISGYSGIGKSALVRELLHPVVQARGYIITGKFDKYQRDIPYSPVAQAFHQLIRQILTESDERIQMRKTNLLEALGTNGRLITDLIPQLELIIGPQPRVPDLPPAEAQNRFHLTFHRFVKVFAKREHPLVIFFDDLQWLDPASLRLTAYLITHTDNRALLLIGAYRNNEVTPSHPLVHVLNDIKKNKVALQELVLEPIKQAHLKQLLADTLSRPARAVAELACLVYEKTAGNPFFAIQFLTLLYQERLLFYNRDKRKWQWDLEEIRKQNFTDNVVELMIRKLNKFPAGTRQALMLAACLGNFVSAKTLSVINNLTEEKLHTTLRKPVDEGLVLRINDSYKFLHDRVQEAAYTLLPADQQALQHLKIGRLLLSHTSEECLNEKIFEIVSHLNRGISLITEQSERERLAELNTEAGKRARASIAYATARDFFALAATLLAEEAWDTRYEFQFTLFLNWAEAEYLHGTFEVAERLFSILLSRAKNDLDRARVYDLRLTVYPITGKYDHAVEMAINALQLLGVEIPEDDETLNKAIESEAAEVKEKLNGRNITDLAEIPEATDPRIKAIIGILIRMGGPAYIGSRPQLYPLTPLKALNYILKYGMSKETGSAFSGYAFMLASVFGDPDAGYAYSELAIRLGQRFNDITTIGTALYIHGNHVNFWIKPISTDFPILERGFHVCLDGGDLVIANYIAYSIVWQAMERGDTLGSVLDFSREYSDFAFDSRNEAIYQTIILEQQFLKCLMGETDGDLSFSDKRISELSCIEKIAGASFTCGITYYHTMKMLAAYLMGDNIASRTHAGEAEKVLSAILAQPMEATFYFLHALVLTRECRETAGEDREKIMKTVYLYREKLAFWAGHCPKNFAGKHALVSAEIAEIEGNELSAEQLFDEAIISTKENGFIHWEAMANESAARFHENRGLRTVSRAYMREARACYFRWEAHGKVLQMDRQYSKLTETSSLASSAKFAIPAEQLDLLAVIKTSQAISGEILLPKLQETLMCLVLEQAGAERGFLLLTEGEKIAIHARAEIIDGEPQVEIVKADPLSTTLPLSLINYIRHTGETVTLGDASGEGLYVSDEYIIKNRPRSVMGLPITRQAQVVGLLYLENNLVADAFTPEKLTVLELLAAQAAVSLETARLYTSLRQENTERRHAEEEIHRLNRELEERVMKRTAELESSNKELESFAYSISHDLRAPLRHINAFIALLKAEADSNLNKKSRYYISVITESTDTMEQLIDNLLSFSRLGRQAMKCEELNMRKITENVIKQFHRDSDGREIRWDIGKLPLISADLSLIRIVMTNLISNAVKFTRKRDHAIIEIGSEDRNGDTVIFVRDNGVGFDQAYADKLYGVFQRLHRSDEFEGTGVGLAIVQRIIHRHGGRVWAEGEVNKGATFYFSLPRFTP